MDCYPEESTRPVILPATAEYIWEKFEFFDKRAQEYPNNDKYEEMKRNLLALWWEKFQKEVNNGN